MSKEQVTQQVQQDTAAPEAAATAQTYGLPPHVYGPLARMGPGDSESLRALLVNYPGLAQQILAAAVTTNQMGNIAIQRAVDMTRHRAVGAQPGSLGQKDIRPGGEFALEGDAPAPLTQQQIRPGGEFALEGSAPAPLTQPQIRPGGEFALEGSAPAPLTQPQIRPGGEFALEGNAPAAGPLTQQQIRPGGEFALEGNAPAAGPLTQQQIRPGGEFALEGNAPAKAVAPAWVAGAQRYNAAHAELVSEFNEATQGACKGADGELDAQAVARWQAQHGVAADGKVGPHTLSAARHAMAKAGPAGVSATGLASV
jgi:hypothetical protein